MAKKTVTDRELQRFGVCVIKRADALVRKGKIDLITWRNIRKKGLLMAMPRTTVRLTGL